MTDKPTCVFRTYDDGSTALCFTTPTGRIVVTLVERQSLPLNSRVIAAFNPGEDVAVSPEDARVLLDGCYAVPQGEDWHLDQTPVPVVVVAPFYRGCYLYGVGIVTTLPACFAAKVRALGLVTDPPDKTDMETAAIEKRAAQQEAEAQLVARATATRRRRADQFLSDLEDPIDDHAPRRH